MSPLGLTRRVFLVSGTTAIGGLVVGSMFASTAAEAKAAVQTTNAQGAALNAWIRVSNDGEVTLTIPRVEMGQGVYTSLAQLAAEELDIPWEAVRIAHAPVGRAFKNLGLLWDGSTNPLSGLLRALGSRLSFQITGGSNSIRDGWTVLRPAGATARAMLIEEAADRWGVSPIECTTRLGVVVHEVTGRSATYGELVDLASLRKGPQNPHLADPSTFRLVGTSPRRTDTALKVNGSATFGIDVRLPGMRVAAIRHAPSFGGTVSHFNQADIESRPGVARAVHVGNAVAVVADGFWPASRALAAAEEAGEFSFSTGTAANLNNEKIFYKLKSDLANSNSINTEMQGSLDPEMEIKGAKVIKSEYQVPFLAHATMEPMNCTALIEDNTCEIWLGTQAPDFSRSSAAKTAGVREHNTLVQNQYLGGGFGRRLEADLAAEAVAIARELPGVPIKLIWSREEDMRHDYYRPAAMAQMVGSVVPGTGQITAWQAFVASAPMLAGYTRRNMGFAFGNIAALAADRFEVEEAIRPLYKITNRQVSWTKSETPVPTGNWRSVSNSFGAFFTESFFDELAIHLAADPYTLRRRMLANKPRHLAVLDLAAQRANWDRPLGPRQGRGIAIHESFGAIVAQVVEVTISASGWLTVNRVVSAIDVGFPVNPDGLRAQVESAVIYGLSAALYGGVTITDGAVQEDNFDVAEVVRMFDTPILETVIAPAGGPVGGGGEPALPPVAPALANAVFAASGQRIRSLPFRAHGLA